MKIDIESGEVYHSEEETTVTMSPYALHARVELLSIAYDIAGFGTKQAWEEHLEKALSMGKKIPKRSYEVIMAEAVIRAAVASEFSTNGGDLDAAVKAVYQNGKAASIWMDKVMEVDPESTHLAKRKAAKAQEQEQKRQKTGNGWGQWSDGGWRPSKGKGKGS